MSFTDIGENAVLDAFFTIFGATCYLGFSTTTPADDGSNFTEPGGANYSRIAITNSSFGAAASGSRSNSSVLDTAIASGSWGTLTYAGIFVASSGGTPRLQGALTSSQAVTTNQFLRLAIGALVMSLD